MTRLSVSAHSVQDHLQFFLELVAVSIVHILRKEHYLSGLKIKIIVMLVGAITV